MVNAKAAFATALKILKNAGIDDALLNARLLFTFITNKDHRTIGQNEEISETEQKQLIDACRCRGLHQPLQYILGSWQFMNLELKVGKGVLIPRADSECVCIAAIEKLKNINQPVVYDLCAGSGALGLAIKEFVPKAQVKAVELSDDAYVYLKHNAGNKIQTVKADVLNYYQLLSKNSIDLIISNPPYIGAQEMEALQPELAFEPAIALTDGKDGLSFYRAIAKNYYSSVSKNGWLVFEIGYTQAQAVTEICIAAGWKNISVQNDVENRPRVITAHKL